jgi:glutaminyl-tRNA synthetase
MAVLDPIKLVIENYPADKEEMMDVPNHPQKPDWGKRRVPFSRELWIERDDFQDPPPKGYFRLFPGNKVRLRYAYVVECIGYDKATDTVRCRYIETTRSGTPGADSVKVKGNIHWVSAQHAAATSVHLYDRLYKVEHPEGKQHLNPDSKKTITAQLEPMLDTAKDQEFQFERHGYFVRDRDSYDRAVTMRDSWGKQ